MGDFFCIFNADGSFNPDELLNMLNLIRTVALRTGIVLSKDGGALKKMKTPIITSLGNGKQYMPWINIF